MSEATKTLHIHKKDLPSLEEAFEFASTVIKLERLVDYSLNIAELTSSIGTRKWYDVQIEGRVRHGESDQAISGQHDPDEHVGPRTES